MTLLVAKQEDLRSIGSIGGSHGNSRLGDLPRLTTTVPREYVHRASLAEVFLTSCEKIDDTRFSLTGQWPRAHTFFSSSDGLRHDPLQVAETLRQVGLYLAHSELGVPLGHQFLMWDLSFTTHPEHLGIGTSPSDLTLDTVCTQLVWKGSRLAEFGMDITLWRDGNIAARGGGRFSCVSAASYRRLRGSAEPKATAARTTHRAVDVEPSDFGRTLRRDVVLAPTEQPGRWLLDPDPSHPIMFDHEGDHVPGMVLVEAARQAACGLLAPGYELIPASVSTDFFRYAEFDSPCWIEATPLPVQQSGMLNVRVTGHQDDHQVFTSQVSGPLTEQ